MDRSRPLLEGVRFAGSGVTSGEFAPKRIYVIGGGTTQAADGCNLTQYNDPETGDWTYGTQMPTIRSGLRVAVVDDVLYAIGGFNTDGDNLAVNEQYTPTGYITEHPSQGIPPTTVVAVLCATVAIVAILVAVILKKQKNHSGYRSAT